MYTQHEQAGAVGADETGGNGEGGGGGMQGHVGGATPWPYSH